MSNKLFAAQYAENLSKSIGELFVRFLKTLFSLISQISNSIIDLIQELGAKLHVSDKEVLGDRIITVQLTFVDGVMHVPEPAE
jgi:hypothetical protein